MTLERNLKVPKKREKKREKKRKEKKRKEIQYMQKTKKREPALAISIK